MDALIYSLEIIGFTITALAADYALWCANGGDDDDSDDDGDPVAIEADA